MNKHIDDDADLVKLASDMLVKAQAMGVQVLEAEMKALAQVMPGAAQGDLPTEAEVEAGFDNMPV